MALSTSGIYSVEADFLGLHKNVSQRYSSDVVQHIKRAHIEIISNHPKTRSHSVLKKFLAFYGTRKFAKA
jgi:hypothetical protein